MCWTLAIQSRIASLMASRKVREPLETGRTSAPKRRMLKTFGINERRVWLAWISASEGLKLQQVVTDMVSELKKLGPLDLPGKLKAEDEELKHEG